MVIDCAEAGTAAIMVAATSVPASRVVKVFMGDPSFVGWDDNASSPERFQYRAVGEPTASGLSG
ncbi:hypothetical protein MEX01_39170 [Methylorubrum extorquens]|nr:hypothetical protein MEX01_39170 [Methylorubrum extorquens]